MQVKRFFSSASLAQKPARQKKKRRQELIAASALIFKDLRAIFTLAPALGASLFASFVCVLQIFVHHWFFQIFTRVFCFSFYNWQAEEDGVMGGHTRRSKQSAKSSSTVICDSATSLEDWKQQIKVKDSIPANQQRLTFTSQRLVKQPIALANFRPSRQWQIVVDASIEELCKDLRHWRATLLSKNTSAELIEPSVLKESDELASNLHSRTADELREIGVPCNVFFLSFDKWIPNLRPGIVEEHILSNRQPRGLDLKIDEEFRQNIFLIDLCGDLNGLCLSMPLSYVMNGSQLATKLFMVEQTAQYREDQQQRYRHFSAPALKDSDAENAQGSIEVNCWSSHLKDYIIEIEQNCEFTAFITKDHHRLRCIVLPVITIPLLEARGSEEQPSFYLLSGDLKEAIGESTSNVLALPSTSQSGEESNLAATNIVGEALPCAAPDYSTQKNTKKKKKRKAKKAGKENVKKPTHTKSCAKAEREAKLEVQTSFSCEGAAMKHLQEKVATVNTVKHHYSEDVTKRVTEDELQCLVGNEPEHGGIGSTQLIRDLKDLSLAEMEEKSSSSKQSSFPCSVHSDQKQIFSCSLARLDVDNPGSNHGSISAPSSRQIPKETTDDFSFDHCDQVMDGLKDQDDALGTSKSSELVKIDDASMHIEMPASCSTNADHSDLYDLFGQRRVDSVHPSLATVVDSGRYRISKTADMKKFKESLDNEIRVGRQNILHREVVGDYATSSFNCQNERWEHAGSYTRSNRDSRHYLPSRSRVNQNSFSGIVPGDSRSCTPFWRHQRNGFHCTSQSWSRPRLARPDDWSVDRGFPPASRQLRHIPTWEQLPDLRQPSNGTRYPNHWEKDVQFDKPWSLSSRGQSYSGFNMQQRNFGKINKVSQKYSDKWQLQGAPNDTVSPNMKFLSGSLNTSNASSIPPSISAEMHLSTDHFSRDFGKDSSKSTDQGSLFGMDMQSEGETGETSIEVDIVPFITEQTASATIASSLQKDQWPTESESSRLQMPNSQVVEHVCNILEAVNASYEAWGVYERVSSMNGKALCEFEKVAKAVAPAFKASMSLQCWELMGCSCRSLVAGFSKSKNRRHVPDVRLHTLWEWYEEPSCYGLKVKLSESSKRTGNQLQAFFVPYLSGIQLFGWSKKKRTTGNKDRMAAQGDSSLFDSGVLSQPIFSILLPRPVIDDDMRTNEDMSLQAGTRQKALDSEFGGDSSEVDAISSNRRHCHCDVELLYEFFEAEKPQQRKPLTDRIKELILSPGVCSDSEAHVLNSAKIGDLHPSSWFAVAWYPIYKIPDETFRSAFLTYHCLSSLQSACSGSTNASHCTDNRINTITAPVIGLMSYNAQAKDWYSLSPSCNVNPSDVLQQYLAKLETTAACMARGSCDQSSSFKHSDFTFFQSRGR